MPRVVRDETGAGRRALSGRWGRPDHAISSSSLPTTVTDKYLSVFASSLAGKRGIEEEFSGQRYRTRRRSKECFSRKFGIAALAVIAMVGLADRVKATYVRLDFAAPYTEGYQTGPTVEADRLGSLAVSMYAAGPGRSMARGCDWWYAYSKAGDYIDRNWYYYLDERQYQYLDTKLYKLLGGLNYLLGHPCYPRLYERDVLEVMPLPSQIYRGGFSFYGRLEMTNETVWLLDELALLIVNMGKRGYDRPYLHFNAGDYIDKWRYYFLDRGQYHYLDMRQYNLAGGLSYMFGLRYYQYYPLDFRRHQWLMHSGGAMRGIEPGVIPEPSTMGLLAFGALGVLRFGGYKEHRSR